MGVTIEDWQQRGQLVELNGRKIFVVDEGSADLPTVLLLHGFPTASWDWLQVWERLRKTQRVVAFDFLGFGFSDKPKHHRYSIGEQADLTESLVRHCKLETFHVLAHDYGDTVAQELLARQNSSVGAGRWLSLVLLNGGLFPETHEARLIQKLLLSRLGAVVGKLINKRAFARSFSRVWGDATQPTEDEIDSFWRLIRHNDGHKVTHRLIHYMSDRIRHRERWLQSLRDADLPIGLINGSADPVSGAHMVARYREIVADDHFVAPLAGIGHYPQVESSDACMDAYETFRAGR